MTQTIDIKAIIITALLAAAVIALAAMAMAHSSVAVPRVQTWQADSSWTGGWNRF